MVSNVFRLPNGRLAREAFINYESSSVTLTVANGFFEAGAPPAYSGILKRWTGSSWARAKLKVYGGSWVIKPLKRWTGSSWVTVDTEG